MAITPNDPANFTPARGSYKELSPFRFWCQKVLPLVYDDSLSYYELLNKVVNYLNITMEDVTTLEGDVTNLHTAYVQLQTYVNDYFVSLDVQREIDNKLDEMASDGSLTNLIEPFIPDLITEWLNDHITPTSPIIDNTLNITGASADSKRVGENLGYYYDPNKIYKCGEYCVYNGYIYKAILDFNEAEPFTLAHWNKTNVSDSFEDNAHYLDNIVHSINYKNPIILNTNWEQGSISNTGLETTSLIRLRSGYIPLEPFSNIIIEPINGYNVEIEFYNNNKEYIGDKYGFNSTKRMITENENDKYIRLVISKPNKTDAIILSDSENVIVSGISNLTNLYDVNKDRIDSLEKMLNNDESYNIDLTWEQGSINSSGEETNSVSRIRTNYIYVRDFIKINIKATNNYRYEIDYFDENKSIIGSESFTNYLKTVTENRAKYIRLIAKEVNDNNITPNEGTNVEIVGFPKNYINNIKLTCITENKEINNVSNWYRKVVGGAGNVYSSDTRICSDYLKVNKGDVLYITFDMELLNPLYYMEIAYFDNNLNFDHTSDWLNSMIIIEHDCYIRINIRHRDGTQSITDSDFISMVENIFWNKKVVNNSNIFNDNHNIKSINHRGWNEAPENTLPAYLESFKHGFRYVETDIRFTSDNVPVCLHDSTLNRTGRNADGSAISGTVNISDITYEQSQVYDMGIYKNNKYAGTKLPKLEDFLVYCKELDLLPYLDFGGGLTKEQIEMVVDTVFNAGMTGKVTYIVGTLKYGTWIINKDEYARVGCVSTLNERFCDYCYTFLTGYNSAFMNVSYTDVTAESIENAKRLGLPVEVWTVNDTNWIDSMNEYISGVTSDSINTSEYFESMNDVVQKPNPAYNRVTNILGGYTIKGNVVHVEMSFDSSYSANDTPTIMSGMPTPKMRVGLNCFEVNSENDEISPVALMIAMNGSVSVNKIATNNTYIVTGNYEIN